MLKLLENHLRHKIRIVFIFFQLIEYILKKMIFTKKKKKKMTVFTFNCKKMNKNYIRLKKQTHPVMS